MEWHPSADNVLASAGHDNMVVVWNVKKGVAITTILCHTDTVHSLGWDRTGARLATTCKDKRLRLIDARTGSVQAWCQAHPGGKASKVVWLADKNLIFTTGFSRHSERQFALWDPSDLSKPVRLETLDCSSGVLNPIYDPDTSMMYLIGRGDGNVRFYEILPEAPWVFYLSEFVSGTPHRSLAVLPKVIIPYPVTQIILFPVQEGCGCDVVRGDPVLQAPHKQGHGGAHLHGGPQEDRRVPR